MTAAVLAILLVIAGPARLAEPELEREPAVAGRFYPLDPAAIGAAVDRLLEKAKRPALSGSLAALLVPHAGIEFSGEAAAAAYRAFEPGDFDTIILIGTGHHVPVEGAALYPGPYATPLGRMAYDAEAAKVLLESPFIRAMPEAHRAEHSIEVQVPFLVRRFPAMKLVALVMNSEELAPALGVGAALARAARGRKVLLAASSDLSHYPPGEVADKVDRTTLAALETLDPAFFWSANRFLMNRRLPDLRCTYCGEGAVTSMLAAARELGANRTRLLSRYNSGDAISEHIYRSVVGYAAVALVRDPKAAPRPVYDLTDADRRALLAQARESLRRKLSGEPADPAELSERPAFNLPAAVFVTLHAPPGKTLRGCIGTTAPHGSLLEGVRRFAVAAGFEDSRFKPLEAAELSGLRLEISILSPPAPVQGPSEVRPGRHGVILERGGKSGLFLPQVWEQLPDKKDFLAELCSQKAGLPRDCAWDRDTRLSVFTVESFEERPD
ncbi:MAG: AmmeMemoRadiSam system protein B [Elusimicrobia bacterium]|nr:AmmeMemoRadiSam system protein B [Elusimicrobiota bacterium]